MNRGKEKLVHKPKRGLKYFIPKEPLGMPINQKVHLLLFLTRRYGFCSNADCSLTDLSHPAFKGQQRCPSTRGFRADVPLPTHVFLRRLPLLKPTSPTRIPSPLSGRLQDPSSPARGARQARRAPRHCQLCPSQRGLARLTDRRHSRRRPQ